MPREVIDFNNVEQAVRWIIFYLEELSNTGHKSIYFDGWRGLAASAVLRRIAEDPPPSLQKKFDKIIHIDCSRWKSRRALQRTIAQQVKLPKWVMDNFDTQDDEDDFRGIDEGSRDEIECVGREIIQILLGQRCLVVFHNGSNDMVNLRDYGILQGKFFDTTLLWTFRGRFRLYPGIGRKVDRSHLFLYSGRSPLGWNYFLENEAREIARYADKLDEVATECSLYLLSLNSQGGNIVDYGWPTHASSYWVCDGIIQGGQGEEAWEAAAALHHQICIKDYSSNTVPSFGCELKTPPKRWILARGNSETHARTKTDTMSFHPESTSLFLVAIASGSDPPLWSLSNDMFHQSKNLHVLKLCGCTFSFTCPPFHCCRNLRFLGLDSCQNIRPEEDEKPDIVTMDFVKSLWVIDICHTDWDLPSSPEIIEQMAANMREVHIKNGRFWHNISVWGQLHNLRKLRIIDPTCTLETGEKNEFRFFPSLSRSTSLRTLVLDGCVSLEKIEGLPLSLEVFSLVAGVRKDDCQEAKISCISLVGCARLSDFTLHGSLPNLEELDLSGTRVKTLDLTTQAVHVPCLQRVVLLGCEQLRAILWPKKGMAQLSLLCIDTRGEEMTRTLPVFEKLKKGHCQAYVAMMDMKFIQLLVLTSSNMFWNSDTYMFSLNLCISACGQCNKKEMESSSHGKILGPAQPKSLITNPSQCPYIDIYIDDITIDHDYNSASQFRPSGCHVEIGEGISNTGMESIQGNKAIFYVMEKAESLDVHDNSSIATVIPELMMSTEQQKLTWKHLKSCHVVRCPKMHTVFDTMCRYSKFQELLNIWVSDLLMTQSIWSKHWTSDHEDHYSFVKLQRIHLFSCPRLKFVLVMSRLYTLRSLEILHIVFCGDLRQVFPVEPEIMPLITRSWHINSRCPKGALEFPNLKHIYLHELHKLQDICEAKMFAPKLETFKVRGCWGLRRLPATGQESRPVVDCEKDWWEKLEWDGPEAGHDPSLFVPRHSAYYKKKLPRASVLR
ncbi:hypothetical protein CFC21_105624 [Triticum aestivum]|uniref:Disease resistance protein At4g27190-like leucine-rich repeats domain-containing protein n=3 Tax=Triticum aestivum TaxID=4565 RepID=A0A9R1MCN8_WHEAT|nr:uncharacterized protein LOC123155574 isoform X1 [Triticum aestivum]XP_044429654.1 uncharacterized protein LOC123155574 isoform X1 [Triticum aestivum]KAF7104753.1 hypothetical protein CFC21_105624 [Triticum aestivum]